MGNEFRFLEFEGVQIAAFIESRTVSEHPGYHANNILFYVEQGQLNIRENHKLHTIPKGNLCFVRKFTNVNYFKTWEEHEKCAIVKAMILQDELIEQAINQLELEPPKKAIQENVINLKNNSILLGLFESLTLYIAENESPDKHLMFLKTKEALLGILKSNPKILAVFYEFSKPVKAELTEFMKHHITSTAPLATLAKLSGRSLSTFNRDFKKIYNTSPHSWLLKARLQKAKELLLTTLQKPSDLYLELGFKDLAHFSKTFKKEFGVPPSKIRKKLM